MNNQSRAVLLIPFAFILLYMVYSMGPLFWLLISSFKGRMDLFTMPPKIFFTPDWSGYQAVFGVGAAKDTAAAIGVVDALINSIVCAFSGTFLAVLFGTLAGYSASRFDFPGKGDFMFFVLSTRMVPAIEHLREAAWDVQGPFPADTVFQKALHGEFHAVVAPYHDVAMAAFKTVSFGSGVNVTLGLPFIRTSPDHGTAFELAGTGRADESSMREAMALARRLASARFDTDSTDA